jgi:hypothetical protein
MTTHEIKIDMDKKCPKCGKAGVPCLKCEADRFKQAMTNEVLQEIAKDIEKLLIEKQEQIEWAFKKVPDGFKISIGVNIEHTIPPTVDYSVSFPMEPAREPIIKETVKLRKVIGQAELEV